MKLIIAVAVTRYAGLKISQLIWLTAASALFAAALGCGLGLPQIGVDALFMLFTAL
jgi:hypothetical protein